MSRQKKYFTEEERKVARRLDRKRWYEANRPAAIQMVVKYREEHPDQYKQYRATYARKLREKVIDTYGRQCTCCGETQIQFLAIDHVDGGRPEIAAGVIAAGRLSTVALYSFIIRNNFPPSFQILCHNCNQALGAYGFCHEVPV